MSEGRSKPAYIARTGRDLGHTNVLRIPPGSLVVVTDIPVYELADAPDGKSARNDQFLLESSDGAFSATVQMKDLEFNDEEEWVSLSFEGLPTTKSYTLKAMLHGEEEATVFENLSYAELTQPSEVLEKDAKQPSEHGAFC